MRNLAELKKQYAKMGEEIKKLEKGDVVVPDSWEDLDIISGYYISSYSKIIDIRYCNVKEELRNIVPTKELVEAQLALCQLLQLRNRTWGDWKPDWKDYNSYKFVIETIENEIEQGWCLSVNRILAFKTEEIRDEFLKKHRELIEVAKPLL